MRVPAGTSTARYGTAAVEGGANSDHAATATSRAPASHLDRGGRSNHSTPRTYETERKEERGSVGTGVALGFRLVVGTRLAAAAGARRTRTRVGDVVTRALE